MTSNRESFNDDSDMEFSLPPTPIIPSFDEQASLAPQMEDLAVQSDSHEASKNGISDVIMESSRSSLHVLDSGVTQEIEDAYDSESDMDVSLPPSPQHNLTAIYPGDDDLYGGVPDSGSVLANTPFREESSSSGTADDDDSIPGLTISARMRSSAPITQTLETRTSSFDAPSLAMSPRHQVEPTSTDTVTHSPLKPAEESGGEAPELDVTDPNISGDDPVRDDPASSTMEITAAETGLTSAKDVSAEDVSAERPLKETLRMVVKMRLQCDHQAREDRIEPILLANHALAEPASLRQRSSGKLFYEVNTRIRSATDAYHHNRSALEDHFNQRQSVLLEKVHRLREEYLTLHRRWLIHCAKLDEVITANALEEAAATAGRTTRRSTTVLGDAVRSDLEMEQIIASLGNEELTDANHLAIRNVANIPDMISVTRGAVDYVYDDNNNIVDNPADFYAPRTGIDDWTEEEKATFLEKFVETPKQFGLIAQFLPNKTAAQCVTYYYLHKRTFIDFRKALSRQASGKRKRGGRRSDNKQKGNALLADIRKRDDEVFRDGPTTRRKRAAPTQPPEGRKSAVSRRTALQEPTEPTETPSVTPDPEPEPRRRRRRIIPAPRAMVESEQADADSTEVRISITRCLIVLITV